MYDGCYAGGMCIGILKNICACGQVVLTPWARIEYDMIRDMDTGCINRDTVELTLMLMLYYVIIWSL